MMPEDDVVFVGQKPVTAYVMACVAQFNRGTDKVILKARGKAISRCVDVAEVLNRRFMQGLVEVEDIQISTEVLDNREGRSSNVSAIEITIKKTKKS